MSEAAQSKINKKKLILEIAVIILIVCLPSIINFSSWFLKQPIGEREKYDDESSLYQEVVNFDYDQGNREELEQRLEVATSQIRDPIQYFFNIYAKATYYCNIGDYETCYASLEKANDFCPSKDYCRAAEELRARAAAELGLEYGAD